MITTVAITSYCLDSYPEGSGEVVGRHCTSHILVPVLTFARLGRLDQLCTHHWRLHHQLLPSDVGASAGHEEELRHSSRHLSRGIPDRRGNADLGQEDEGEERAVEVPDGLICRLRGGCCITGQMSNRPPVFTAHACLVWYSPCLFVWTGASSTKAAVHHDFAAIAHAFSPSAHRSRRSHQHDVATLSTLLLPTPALRLVRLVARLRRLGAGMLELLRWIGPLFLRLLAFGIAFAGTVVTREASLREGCGLDAGAERACAETWCEAES